MDTKKIIKRSIAGLVYLSVILLAVLAVSNHLHLKKISQGVNPGTPAKNESAGPSVSENDDSTQRGTVQDTTVNAVENKSVTDKAEVLKARLEATEKELDMTYNQISDEQTRKAEALKKAAEAAQKAFEDPATMKSIRDRMIKRLGSENSEYAPLFYKLNLSPEELDRLKEIWFDNETGSYETYLEKEGVITPSEEKRAELEQRYREIHEAYESDLRALLGEDDYERYRGYEDRAGERMYLKEFLRTIDSTEGLSEEAQKKLVEAMHEQAMTIDSGIDKDEVLFPSERYDDNAIANSVDYMARIDEAYVQAAQDIMSPSQAVQFREYLETRRQRYESYMKRQAQGY